MLPSATSTGEVADPVTCQAMIWFAVVPVFGLSAATTYVLSVDSIVLAGTGVNARSPSSVLSPLRFSGSPNTVATGADGQVVAPSVGFGTLQMRAPLRLGVPRPPCAYTLLPKTRCVSS